MKHLLTNIKIAVLSFLGQFLLKSIFFTCKEIEINNKRNADDRTDSEKPVVICFWHGHQVIILGVLKGIFKRHLIRKVFVLISEHSDGRIIANVIRYFNLYSIAGSSSRSAKKATLQLLKTLDAGDSIAITPDGPRGPVYEIKQGVVKIAELSGCSILPISIHATRHWKMKSWDQMQIPKPFSKIVFMMGDIIEVPKDITEEKTAEFSTSLKTALDRNFMLVSGYAGN